MAQSNTGRRTGFLESGNSTSTPLNSGATFTGTGIDCSAYPSVMVSCKTDQNGAIYVEFSTDNVNWDSSLMRKITANINKPMRCSIRKKI